MVTTTAASGAAPPADAATPAARAAKPTLDVYKQSFREYLRETQAVGSDEELDALMALLHAPLPVSFRLNLHRPDAERLKHALATSLQFPPDAHFHAGVAVNPPAPIPWYPLADVAWQMDCGRVALSKTAPKHEAVKRFHAWLLEHTERGNIDRQEAVSMLPVLFLGVRQGDRVLDMCASPGSKTTQALDLLLHASAASTTAFTTASTTSQGGLVVANDLDKSRAYMLVHRLTRNTLRHAVVTCGPGDAFPGLYAPSAGVEPPQLRTTNVFDRVLCDVPCSGDGTLRKNQSLWKEWHIGQGLTLHPTQLALALRGAALLRVGGVMVYSTCSFNPVENEAVVAELLRRSDGALELLDVSQRLEQLITREGRTKWKLGWRSKSKSTNKGHLFRRGTIDADDSAEVAEQPPQEMLHDWFERYEHVPTDLRGSRVLRSMFPPAESSEVAASLRKTLRLIPIDQNSGGFFVAVLRKVSDLPGENQAGLPAMPEDDQVPPPADYVCKLCNASGHFLKNCALYVPENEFAVVNPPKPKKQRVESAEGVDKKPKKGKKEKKRETLYRPVGDDVWHLIRQFYGISDDSVKERLWCRSDTAVNVNYVDRAISDACLGGDALDIVNTGLKVFSKVSEKGETYYRPSEESLGFIDRFFTQRVVSMPATDLTALLDASQHIPFALLSVGDSALAALPVGPAVAALVSDRSVCFNVWIGKGAVLPRVSKTMRAEIRDALAAAASDSADR